MTETGRFGQLKERIEALGNTWTVKSLGALRYTGTAETYEPYEQYEVVAGNLEDSSKHPVLLSGGVHGNEPAGAFAVTTFLETEAEQYLDRFSFLAYPCVNPSGFDADIVNNAEGFNLNRQCKRRPATRENALILASLEQRGLEYLFSMDHHETSQEDVDPREGYSEGAYPSAYYLYESCWDERLRVGRHIVTEIEKGAPVCKWPKVAGDVNSGGVIYGPQFDGNPFYAEMNSFESGLLKLGFTGHSFSVETFRGWDMEFRVYLQIKTLKLALELCSHGH